MDLTKTSYLSLGSNKGNRIEYLQKAIDQLAIRAGNITKISSVYQTQTWGFTSSDFYNVCIKIKTSKSPIELLQTCLYIESILGRASIERGKIYEDRYIDIDILLFNCCIIKEKDLILPHPRMLERKFVLEPLNEIASQYQHPICLQTIASCLANNKDNSNVYRIKTILKYPINN